MGSRHQKNIYCFIYDENKKYYRADQQRNGNYSVSSNSIPYPIRFNPTNLLDSELEFATNDRYFSMFRSVVNPLIFVKDGAAILRQFYFLGKGAEQKVYITVIEWNGVRNLYDVSYKGKLDLSEKDEDPKLGQFQVPVVDDSAWGVLSKVDTVQFSIDCTNRNPKAIRVLLDGITLLNKATYQTIQSYVHFTTNSQFAVFPFALVNQDGDSAGVIFKNQTLTFFSSLAAVKDISDKSQFMETLYDIPDLNVNGSLQFNVLPESTDPSVTRYQSYRIFFYKTDGTTSTSYYVTTGFNNLQPAKKELIKFNFDFTFDLLASEKLYFIVEYLNVVANSLTITITPVVTNITVSTKTRPQPVVRYGLRAGDLLEQLTYKATRSRYTVKSDYFSTFNKSVVLSGESIRDIPNAKIYSSFRDFFDTFDALNWMALRSVNGDLFMEKVIEVYKQAQTIIDLGEASDIKLACAKQYFANEVIVGSPNQDYRHPSGRLEFNSKNTFSLPLFNTDKKLEIVTKYRTGCYDITFLILDYQGQSTQDNSGDKSVYVVDITDEKDYAVDNIETFENITFDSAILNPIIKSPLNNDTVSYDKPVIRGVAPVGSAVNIYVDGVLDGSTITGVDYKWSYNIVTSLTEFVAGITTGIHLIQATFGDLSDPLTSISLFIDTSIPQVVKITYPNEGDNLYNNLPIIKGVAQFGTVVTVSLDGIVIGIVTADESCKWILQSTVISNGNHTLLANTDTIDFMVDSSVEYPLITFVESEIDGFVVINNLPLIKGVAIPGTIVTLWLNYISYFPLGTTTADSNGDWIFQVVPVTYPDPLSGIPVVLAPIQNGLNIISTSLVNHTVSINVQGYKLNRPAYSSITGVPDNTVFNTRFSPKQMILNHGGLFASMLAQQTNEKLYFETASKNGVFSRTLDGVTISENDDVPLSLLGNPLLLLETAKIKTKTRKSFQQTLEDFSNGGIVKTKFRGTNLYCLPIGRMKMKTITSEVQNWDLLMSPLTSYFSLLNLYKNGQTITIMDKSIYHSDYNSLHFVFADFTLNPSFNFKEIYDDWFVDRNDAWVLQPDYVQKFQQTESFRDQIIVNNVSDIHLDVYRCRDGIKIGTIDYVPALPVPIDPPEVVLEAFIDLSIYDEQIYFVMRTGVIEIGKSEMIHVKPKWDKTILVRASNSVNFVGAFFSTGFELLIRCEGLVKKWQPDVQTFLAEEDNGDTELLYAVTGKKRTIRFGTAYGLPDYMYLKMSDAATMDSFNVEDVFYAVAKDEKISPSDDIDGHPLYYYNINVTPIKNDKGIVFPAADDSDINSVILVVDATAFGLPVGSLININVNNE